MSAIRRCELPAGALLNRYSASGAYVDCYVAEIAGIVSHAEFVEAFYTSAVFKLERSILRLLISRSSTDTQAKQLAQGTLSSFAAWSVEGRAPDQLLLVGLHWPHQVLAHGGRGRQHRNAKHPAVFRLRRRAKGEIRRGTRSVSGSCSRRCSVSTNSTRGYSWLPPGPGFRASLSMRGSGEATPHLGHQASQEAPMHRSRLGNIVIDCQTDDLLSEAQFWSAALGYPLPQDLDAASNFIQLVTPAGDVQVIMQRVRHLYPVITVGWSCKPPDRRTCITASAARIVVGFEQGARVWE